MAEGKDRDIRDGASEPGKQPEQALGSGEQKRGKFVIVSPATVASNRSAGSSRAERRQSARQSAATATVTSTAQDVHGSENNQPQQSGINSNKTTPALTRNYPRKRTVYPSIDDAKNTAAFLVSAIEVVGVTAAGPQGEMTEFERGMISPPLTRILHRTPLSLVERASPIIDGCVLILGFGMYASRAFGHVIPKRNPTPNVQEDNRAPQAAPPQQVVRNTKAGDINGIAVPVPDVITSNMNGAI